MGGGPAEVREGFDPDPRGLAGAEREEHGAGHRDLLRYASAVGLIVAEGTGSHRTDRLGDWAAVRAATIGDPPAPWWDPLTGDGSTLVGVDPASGAVVTTVVLGARGTDLGIGEAGLWVVSTLDDQALRIDPDAATVALRVTGLDAPVAVSVTDSVWVGTPRSTLRLDPATGAVQVSSPIGTETDGRVTAEEDGVWVRSAGRFLGRRPVPPATSSGC